MATSEETPVKELYSRADRSKAPPQIVKIEPISNWSRRSPEFKTRFKIPKREPNEDEAISDEDKCENESDLPHKKAVKRDGESALNPHSYFCAPEDWPEEIKSMCLLDKCTLCNTELSSSTVAEDHYKGSHHRKKMRVWSITATSEKRGVGISLFCKYCHIHLPSEIVASDHYQGRKHLTMVEKSGVVSFTGADGTSGFYERSGSSKEDTTGRFGIGEKFLNNVQPRPGSNRSCSLCNVVCTDAKGLEAHLAGIKHRKKENASTFVKVAAPDDETALPLAFGSNKTKVFKVPPTEMEKAALLERVLNVDLSCYSCGDVGFEDIVELVDHLKSEAHEEMIVKSRAEINIKNEKEEKKTRCNSPKLGRIVTNNLLTALKSDSSGKGTATQDLSIFRTPSGQYYCPKCNMTLQTEQQYLQHISGKKHKRFQGGK